MKFVKIGDVRFNLNYVATFETEYSTLNGITENQIEDLKENVIPKMMNHIRNNHKDEYEKFLKESDFSIQHLVSKYLEENQIEVFHDVNKVKCSLCMVDSDDYFEFEEVDCMDNSSTFYVRNNSSVDTKYDNFDICVLTDNSKIIDKFDNKFMIVPCDCSFDEYGDEQYYVFIRVANESFSKPYERYKLNDDMKFSQIQGIEKIIDSNICNC